MSQSPPFLSCSRQPTKILLASTAPRISASLERICASAAQQLASARTRSDRRTTLSWLPLTPASSLSLPEPYSRLHAALTETTFFPTGHATCLLHPSLLPVTWQ